MVSKSAIRGAITEVLEEYEVEDDGLGDDLLDRISSAVEVFDDEEEEAEED
jgi:hypothetical protein